DVNSDGLVDIVKNGRTFFNRLDQNGNPYFEMESKLTENMLIEAAPVMINIPELEIAIDSPVYDVVKVWEAPTDGKITIYNDIYKNSDKEAVVTIEMKKYDGVIQCNDFVNSGGGQGYQVFDVDFGTATGFAGIHHNAENVPDKFDIIWNGQLYSTGYVGHSSYNGNLQSLGIPQSEINTGSPSTGNGVYYFFKNTAYPTTAQIIVTAPLGGTYWEFSLLCPNLIEDKPDINSILENSNFIVDYELSIDLKNVKSQNFNVKIDGAEITKTGYNLNNINSLIEVFETTFSNSKIILDNEVLTVTISKSLIEFNKIEFIYKDNSYDIFYFKPLDVVHDNSLFSTYNVNLDCEYNQGELCLLFGARLNTSTSQLNETITKVNTLCDPNQRD